MLFQNSLGQQLQRSFPPEQQLCALVNNRGGGESQTITQWLSVWRGQWMQWCLVSWTPNNNAEVAVCDGQSVWKGQCPEPQQTHTWQLWSFRRSSSVCLMKSQTTQATCLAGLYWGQRHQRQKFPSCCLIQKERQDSCCPSGKVKQCLNKSSHISHLSPHISLSDATVSSNS